MQFADYICQQWHVESQSYQDCSTKIYVKMQIIITHILKNDNN